MKTVYINSNEKPSGSVTHEITIESTGSWKCPLYRCRVTDLEFFELQLQGQSCAGNIKQVLEQLSANYTSIKLYLKSNATPTVKRSKL